MSRGRGRPPKGSVIKSDLPELLTIWDRAAKTPAGIKIESQYPKRLAAKLYAARREVAYEDYLLLKIVTTETEVWILPNAQ